MAHVTFQLNYHTTWGQQVCLCGSTSGLGMFDEDKALLLSCDGDRWYTDLKMKETDTLEYYYLIRQGDSTIRREWGARRRLRVIKGKKTYIVQDHWKEKPYHAYLYSSVFIDSIFHHQKKTLPAKYYSRSLLLNLICPYANRNQAVAVCGEAEMLGGWDPRKARLLSCVSNGEWQLLLDANLLPERSEYKFLIVDRNTGDAVHWEEGANRILDAGPAKQSGSVAAEMSIQYRYPGFSFKGTGTAIPIFSLRTAQSFGIGDFADLRKMIDWVSHTRQQLIQLLPVNDTTTSRTWKDSYPYSAISIYALHPIYLGCSDYPLKNKKKQRQYLNKATALNRLDEIDYEQVLRLKTAYMRDLFLENRDEMLASEAYNLFHEKNREWLFPYACYCTLRDRFGSANFREWESFATYNEVQLKDWLENDSRAEEETHYWYCVQYLLHRQFSAVKAYAHERGVTLKGDIPIGINRDSMDAWTSPGLFHMDTQSGAPPDDFSFIGQNWGFPTYNWHAMEKEGFAWWINRFRKMADYFDAYRIDHILGFFRIWEIPLDAVQGLLGHFSPALPYCPEEISRAGIPFDEERMVQPFIHEQFLSDLFGEYAEEVREHYLEVSGWQRFRLKSCCDTQRKIKLLFEGRQDDKSNRLRDGLYSLCTEVLFVRDPLDRNRFHPRITAQYTYSYRTLDDSVKEAFNRLYNDFFYSRHNYFWREQAMRKLPGLVASTSMLVCGEDLGMVPDCVPSVMRELQMLSLEIERMPKDPKVLFTDLKQIPFHSVCTTSTHDMSPIRLWWSENRALTQRYYNDILHHEGVAPEACSAELCREIIAAHLRSSAMWVILPWQDWMSLNTGLRNPDASAERINVPANPEHYWRYRMHLSLDELIKETAFNKLVAEMSRRD
ncbi:MAG: 4-alpha-glucanotransferase [bacterium]|nr:4-alpha-glucanotransferase [bacterium]MDD3624033.1 4-alpha-glucanotransferase [Proteiniphilum sp.]MDD3967293.1 4-alpha-glucanotransferase [Proteiniphilum sp.]MDD4459213.1 4-alpha-glucanotransferase [Proteiniphilum sp.]